VKLLPAALALWLGATAAGAVDRWQFEPRLAVTDAPAAGVFHHLDGAGHKHIAVSSNTIAAVWEDNRDGSPQVYASLHANPAAGFSPAIRVSDGSEAYEPVVTGVGDGRFALAWEQDGAAWAGLLDGAGVVRRVRLAEAPASHASLAAHDGRLMAAWRERRAGNWFVRIAILQLAAADGLTAGSSLPVEAGGVATPVQFPSLAVNDDGICIAWEDRRAGHTRIVYSGTQDPAAGFAEPRDLNEYFSERNVYDRGSGATRVVLASFGGDEIIAAWMDKRREGAGYGIFASFADGACEIIGPNEKVHGAEGDRLPHRNPAVAGNAGGDFVVAWDDFRRGDADIWLSAYDSDQAWSADHAPSPASGAGEQTNPSVTLDDSDAAAGRAEGRRSPASIVAGMPMIRPGIGVPGIVIPPRVGICGWRQWIDRRPQVGAIHDDDREQVVVVADRPPNATVDAADHGQPAAEFVDHRVEKTVETGDEAPVAAARRLGLAVAVQRHLDDFDPGLLGLVFDLGNDAPPANVGARKGIHVEAHAGQRRVFVRHPADRLGRTGGTARDR